MRVCGGGGGWLYEVRIFIIICLFRFGDGNGWVDGWDVWMEWEVRGKESACGGYRCKQASKESGG